MRGFTRLACGVLAWLVCVEAAAQTPPPKPPDPRPPWEFSDVEELSLDDLLEVTVSIAAAGRVQRLEDAPSIVSVITDEEIRRMGAQTLQEVLITIPGFEVLTDNLGRSRIVIRGIASQLGTSENVLLLFNGRRLNDHMFGGATVANLDIPLYNIKQIEIIRGPGSALFGSNAFAGVINLVSYGSRDFHGIDVSAGGGAYGTQQYGATMARTWGALGVSTSVQLRDTDGPALPVAADAQTLADRALTPFGVPAASLAPGFTRDDRRSVDFTAAAVYKGFGFDARVTDTVSGGFVGRVDILAPGNELSNRQILLSAAQTFTPGPRSRGTATVTFAQTEVREDLQPTPPGFTRVLPDFRMLPFPAGILVDFTANSRRGGGDVVLEYQSSATNQIAVGASVEHESTFGLTTSGNFDVASGASLPAPQPLPTIIAPSSRTVVSAFVQDTWDVSPQVGLTAGVRYDHYSDFGATVNPRAALVWRLPSNLHFKALYGRAFRAPTLAELFVNLPGAISGNPDLLPPTINTIELALAYRAKDLRITGNYFGNFIRNYILSTKPVSVEGVIGSLTYVNTPGLDVQGIELEVRRTLGLNQALFANYTYQHHKERGSGLPAADLPAHLANAGLTAALGPHVSVTPTVILRGERPRVAPDARPRVPAYGIANVTLRLRNLFETFEIAVSVNNLFDKTYLDPSPFATLPGDYPKPGRNVFVKASYKF